MTASDIRLSAVRHKAGYCKVPKGFSHLPCLDVPGQFMTPVRVDTRAYCTRAVDLDDDCLCVAAAASKLAENILWRSGDCPQNIDCRSVYLCAKSLDDEPAEDGTTIPAALKSLVMLGHFGEECRVLTVRPNRLAVKYALHKFGCCLGCFDITDEWLDRTRENTVVSGDLVSPGRGGHCVLLCGYSKDGVWAQNSWGVEPYGEYGFIRISWRAFDRQFLYGGVLGNAMDGMATFAEM